MKLLQKRLIFKDIIMGIVLTALVLTSIPFTFSKKAEAADAIDFKTSDGISINLKDNAKNPYEIRKSPETITVSGYTSTDITWTSSDEKIIKVTPKQGNSAVEIYTLNIGNASVLCKVDNKTYTIRVNVAFAINENTFQNSTVKMAKIYNSDEKPSIIMNTGDSLSFGTSAETDSDKLNLLVGSAQDATWESSNSDIVQVNTNTGKYTGITSLTAGHATLTASYYDPVVKETFTDKVDVYVRPDLTYIYKDSSKTNVEIKSSNNLTDISDGDSNDRIKPGIKFGTVRETINDKLAWTIDTAGNAEFVCDSLGNEGTAAGSASLTFDNVNSYYRLSAKAGSYVIRFYVAGTYKGPQDTAINSSKDRVDDSAPPVTINVTVKKKAKNLDITINSGSSYSLADAFNMTETQFNNTYTVAEVGTADNTERSGSIITGKSKGTDQYQITSISSDETDKGPYTVNVTVTESFQLDSANINMFVGSRRQLKVVINASNYDASPENFEWAVSDPSKLTIEPHGTYAFIEAKAATDPNQHVQVSVSWTRPDAVMTAQCNVTISETKTGFVLHRYPKETEGSMDLGTKDTVFVEDSKGNRLNTGTNFIWTVSDPDIIAVTPSDDTSQATIEAKKSGTAVITVVNPDNGESAPLRITVSEKQIYIKSLKIDKGTALSVNLSEKYVFLNAVYTPKNATNAQFSWVSDNPKVAKIYIHDNDKCVLQLVGEGTAKITLKPLKQDPEAKVDLSAECELEVKHNYIKDFTLDAKDVSINIVKGSTYTIAPEITKDDPEMPLSAGDFFTFASDNDKIASAVTNDGGESGTIKANSLGDAIITVYTNQKEPSSPKTIKVHVRNKLESISFDRDTLPETIFNGDTAKANVIFNPDDDVNRDLEWHSFDNTVATVDDEGNVSGVAEGMTMISCYSEELSTRGAISFFIKVKKRVNATGFKLNETSKTIYAGDTYQIGNTFTPEDATDQEVRYTVINQYSEADPGNAKNNTYVTVDDKGLVTSTDPETPATEHAIIAAVPHDEHIDSKTSDGGYKYRLLLTIVPKYVSADSFSIYPAGSVQVVNGGTAQLSVSFTPENTTEKVVKWESSDDSIFSVSDTGLVTGVATGDAIVTATYTDRDGKTIQRTRKVHVNKAPVPASGFELKKTKETIEAGSSTVIEHAFTPEDASNQGLKYVIRSQYSDLDPGNPNNITYVKVDANGRVTSMDVAATATEHAVIAVLPDDTNLPRVTDDEKDLYTFELTIIPKYVSAADFSIDPEKIEVAKGSTTKASVTFVPENTTSKYVSWQSSDQTIFTVDPSGTITGLDLGDAILTATYTDPRTGKIIQKTRKVTVGRPVAKDFTLKSAEVTIQVGDKRKIEASYTPEDADNSSMSYVSNDISVATVDDKGVITGVKAGMTNITITSADGSVKRFLKVTVINPVELTIKPTSKNIAKGYSFKIKYAVSSSGVKVNVSFKSDDPSIASVDSNGKVTGVKKGTTDIHVRINKFDIDKTCTVKVKKLYTKIKFVETPIKLRTGVKKKLGVIVQTNAPKKPKVSFSLTSSRYKKILKLNKKTGRIRTKKKGTAYVKAKAGKAKAKCKVVVKQSVTSLGIEKSAMTVYVGHTRKLIAYVKPSNAKNKKLKYIPDDRSICTVASDGTVYGVAEGQTFVTVKTTDGSKLSVKCLITVTSPQDISSITIAQQDMTLASGTSSRISYSVVPNDAMGTLEFASDNENVAVVADDGTVTAIHPGTANITILSSNGVTANVAVNVISFDKFNINLRQYDTDTLNVVGGTGNDQVTWSTTDVNVATVDNGKITAKGIGSCYISAIINGVRIQCRINVRGL
jgi:uncharacterized protein YjdB